MFFVSLFLPTYKPTVKLRLPFRRQSKVIVKIRFRENPICNLKQKNVEVKCSRILLGILIQIFRKVRFDARKIDRRKRCYIPFQYKTILPSCSQRHFMLYFYRQDIAKGFVICYLLPIEASKKNVFYIRRQMLWVPTRKNIFEKKNYLFQDV